MWICPLTPDHMPGADLSKAALCREALARCQFHTGCTWKSVKHQVWWDISIMQTYPAMNSSNRISTYNNGWIHVISNRYFQKAQCPRFVTCGKLAVYTQGCFNGTGVSIWLSGCQNPLRTEKINMKTKHSKAVWWDILHLISNQVMIS